jgi:type IV secretory pathway TraG/TraD family ATPase VirD4
MVGPVSPLDGSRNVSAGTRAKAGCNPLAALDPNSQTFCEDAAAIAGTLVNGEGAFENSARSYLTALLLHEQRELASIQSTAAKHTQFLLNAAPAARPRRARKKRLSNG